jgi:hypothetical protein
MLSTGTSQGHHADPGLVALAVLAWRRDGLHVGVTQSVASAFRTPNRGKMKV